MQCWPAWAQDSSMQPTRVIPSFGQSQFRMGVTAFFDPGKRSDPSKPQKRQFSVFDRPMLSLFHAATAYAFPIKPIFTFSS